MFNSTGTTRLAIFPPMELPFANFMITNGLLTLVSFSVILLYGKRAQLVSAILTFVLYIFVFRRQAFFKYIVIIFISSIILVPIFLSNSNNLAIHRLTNTFDLYSEGDNNKQNLDRVSAGRFNEFETIINSMEFKDYFIGKGLGYTYNLDAVTEVIETANAHFSPIGFLSKYGIAFTFFIYFFILRLFINSTKKLVSNFEYLVALSVSIFFFLESFFSYAMFVTPLLPVVLGVLMSYQHRKKKLFHSEYKPRAVSSVINVG
ncbi:MAG: hypothetical protein ACOH2A_08935 [Sphingobacteriaceae bacterium]